MERGFVLQFSGTTSIEVSDDGVVNRRSSPSGSMCLGLHIPALEQNRSFLIGGMSAFVKNERDPTSKLRASSLLQSSPIRKLRLRLVIPSSFAAVQGAILSLSIAGLFFRRRGMILVPKLLNELRKLI
ncbi:Uncharacterized protein Rs2_21241 [Raphanus sativus]|nr:Uncharacterized protein Rs2_21241 [Raphanus sativus]